MAQPNRITVLAAIISEKTAEINSYFVSKGLPTPSFDVDTPIGLVLDPNIAEARGAVLNAMEELNTLMLGPIGTVINRANLPTLKPIKRFNLASTFDKEATFAEIASASGLAEDQVKRIIRHAISHRFFQEPRKGVVTHTAASKLLADDYFMSQWVGVATDETWPAASRIVDAIEKWGTSGEPNHCGYNIAFNTDLDSFKYISSIPQREKQYAESMTWYSGGPGFGASHVVDNYPWGDVSGTVVDIGGSHGNVSIAIAKKYPSLRFTVQDQPSVIELGQAKLPAQVKDRITFMEHNFFDEQPVKGASVYYLRYILHDWSDDYAIRILKALVPALRNGSKILINDHILPEPGVVPPYLDRHLRDYDYAMWALTNGKERDMDDFTKLLSDADPRFKVLKVIEPKGSLLGLIEVGWQDS